MVKFLTEETDMSTKTSITLLLSLQLRASKMIAGGLVNRVSLQIILMFLCNGPVVPLFIYLYSNFHSIYLFHIKFIISYSPLIIIHIYIHHIIIINLNHWTIPPTH